MIIFSPPHVQTSDLVSTVIKLWVQTNSHPCWRQLIYALDCTVDGDTVPLMKCIRHCAEPPKGIVAE